MTRKSKPKTIDSNCNSTEETTRKKDEEEEKNDCNQKVAVEDTANGRDTTECSLNVDSIFEMLRSKLESGQGECLYKLTDPCKYLK